jgi:hypothetical protein
MQVGDVTVLPPSQKNINLLRVEGVDHSLREAGRFDGRRMGGSNGDRRLRPSVRFPRGTGQSPWRWQASKHSMKSLCGELPGGSSWQERVRRITSERWAEKIGVLQSTRTNYGRISRDSPGTAPPCKNSIGNRMNAPLGTAVIPNPGEGAASVRADDGGHRTDPSG